MLVFKADSFAECYHNSILSLFANGTENTARGTKSIELLDVALEISDPRKCLYSNAERGSQKKYIAAELLWYYMGRNDAAFISKWAKFWESIQNPDGTVNSAYGNLIFKNSSKSGLTQYQWAMRSLLTDKNTRQAIMHFNRPEHQYFGNKDFVCTMYANCHIRNNRFYMSVFMRSNDAIWGTPTDVAFFCSLQIQMYNHLKMVYPDLELGTYTHVANSYHVYDRHYELVKRMMESPFVSEELPTVVSNLIEIDGSPSQSLETLMSAIHSTEENYLIFQDGDDLLKWIYSHAIKS
jgi:thymidylate synthase